MYLITVQEELEAAIAKIEQSDFVTVDTEFIRETTFWPELCLIQMATRDTTALVDPLAPGIDLAPFFRLMANENIVKVFHAARQDIEIVFHLGGLIPHPVFDTQVAAMVCGFGDSGSTSAVASGLAIWIRHSSGQKVVSRMNSVSTVTKSDLRSAATAASNSACLVMSFISPV